MIFQNTFQWLPLLRKLRINDKGTQQVKNVHVQSQQKKH